ncbi:MAG: hypothetical protein NWP87_07455 [Winogradskyella sp.]|nr:hypothetical protein [Winogradskyella sp.]
MKRILFLFAGLVALSTTAFGTNNTITEAEASITNYVRGYGNSFIFNEAGIEFSVFADGQFDFFIPNYGPDVRVGINSPGFALSFNTGFDYNPYVQYDSFGAIVQIENTPIFYDFYGRVNQVGNIFINYNGFGRINRIGGLNIHYRNNVFWRYDGYINAYNRSYIWRPWHQFYAVPHVNFCVVNVNPYRQFYAPVRYTYYRPYINNVRHYNINNTRRGYAQVGRHDAINRTRNQYAQSPRNDRERATRKNAERRNNEITRTRENNIATHRNVRNSNDNITRSNTRQRDVSTREGLNQRRENKDRVASTRNNVTKSKPSVSKKVTSTRNVSSREPNTTKSRTYKESKSQSSKQRSVAQNNRKSSSKMTRSDNSRKSNQSSTRSKSSRSRG